LSDLVTQLQAPLFEAPEQQFVDGQGVRRNVYQGIKVRVLHFQFDQLPFRGM
jgi:hypothetical protein